jgi:hypothetical protein
VFTNLPSNMFLEFEHQFASEQSNLYPDSAYDGGIVEISVNGGTFNYIVPEDNYPKVFRHFSSGTTPVTGPMPGLPCYAGELDQWNTNQFDLAAYAGNDVQFRFRFGSDAGTFYEGWYIDDFLIFGLATTPEPTVPENLTLSTNGTDVTLRWNDDDNVSYQIFSAETSDLSSPTLRGSTTGNFYVLPGDADVSLKFYYVVGSNEE